MAAGRPTKYRPEFCQMLVDYFDVPAITEKEIKTTDKFGNEKIRIKEVITEPVTLYGFAASIGVGKEAIIDWCGKFPEFSDSMSKAKAKYAQLLIQNSLMGRYHAGITTLMIKNIFGWAEKSESNENVTQTIKLDVDDSNL